ncbi:MAG: hypothetical protein ACFFF4_15435 [Candidatus Thorarchaeota archaeon]
MLTYNRKGAQRSLYNASKIGLEATKECFSLLDLLEIAYLPLSVITLAFVHALGEIIYKKGGMNALRDAGRARSLGFWRRIISSPYVIASLLISGAVKLIYGIVLVENPLFITGGIYLAAVALFSVLGGKVFFEERITRRQTLGFILVAIGMILLV